MRTQIIGVPVDCVDSSQAIDIVKRFLADDRTKGRMIIQANVQSIVLANENTEYRTAMQGSDLSVLDGLPLVWLLRSKGLPIKTNLRGKDFMLLLCGVAARLGWRCYLYGGKPNVATRLHEQLLTLFPKLKVVGTYSPPFRPLTEVEDADICKMINCTNPDILWVGLGSPKQDIWMLRHRDKLNVSVMHGVGAAFDFLVGDIPEAPACLQKVGLEWLFRLLSEPRRLWRRYTLTNLKFLCYLAKQELLRI
jgi:N-acetylglucosaminyldiphosphoundecaprenol N-acetyl-beta-D-mannosaminyltransferase